MFAFHHSRAAFNSLILLLGSEHAFGQSPRLEPACHEERLAMDSIKAEILAYQLGATSEVPGSEIMAVSYWGAHWRKHETSEIYRTAKYLWPLGQVYAIRKRVEIHFMGRGDALRVPRFDIPRPASAGLVAFERFRQTLLHGTRELDVDRAEAGPNLLGLL